MFGSISRGWGLMKTSYGVLQKDRELLVFPLLSMLGMIVVTIAFFVPLFSSGIFETIFETGETGGELTRSQQMIGLLIMFLFYFVTYTVIIFSNVALIGAAMIRLDGGDPTVSDGFRIASSRIGSIIGYAAIASTVGVILQMIRNDEDNFLAQIVASILDTAWNVITFLVVPVLVVENVNPLEAIKRSGSLLKATWGEQLTASFGMGIISFLIMVLVALVVGGPILFIASTTGSGIIMGLGIAIIVLLLVAVGLFFSALGGIFQAALYKYATEGTTGQFFDEALLKDAFQHKA